MRLSRGEANPVFRRRDGAERIHNRLHSDRQRPHLSHVPSTNLTFSSRAAHRAWLATQAILPAGFRAGTTRLEFTPREAPRPARMNLALIALDSPTPDFGAVFTRNAFPGAPVLIGRRRLAEPRLAAILVNNKIANVCAPNGETAAQQLCTEAARLLGCRPEEVLPSSTGVIGWSLPVESMLAALPSAVAALSADSILPVAEAIVTTDLFPKVRRTPVGNGTIVGIAKGAGMIEPNLATMLVYLLTDLAVPREMLRAALTRAVEESFNCISVDSETSTSDTVVAVASGRAERPDPAQFEAALTTVCRDLAEDVVRNGEGVHHLLRVTVRGAPDRVLARGLGKAIVNAPLFKCAVAGNDPNVGRLLQAIGKYLGALETPANFPRLRLTVGGIEIFREGAFQLDAEKEQALSAHLRQAELYASAPDARGVFAPPIDYPAHEGCVEIGVDLDQGEAGAQVLGGDLTHEYVSENADYRS